MYTEPAISFSLSSYIDSFWDLRNWSTHAKEIISSDETAVPDCRISIAQRCYQRSYAVSENVRQDV